MSMFHLDSLELPTCVHKFVFYLVHCWSDACAMSLDTHKNRRVRDLGLVFVGQRELTTKDEFFGNLANFVRKSIWTFDGRYLFQG